MKKEKYCAPVAVISEVRTSVTFLQWGSGGVANPDPLPGDGTAAASASTESTF